MPWSLQYALIKRAVVNQAGPGTLVLAPASVNNRHKVLGFWLGMANNGSLQFTDNTGILMGAINQQSNTPSMVFPVGVVPFIETAINSPLNLVTTGGAGKGVVIYVTEP